MALTIRLNEEEQAKLDQLMAKTGQKTASGLFKFLLDDYERVFKLMAEYKELYYQTGAELKISNQDLREIRTCIKMLFNQSKISTD